MDSLRVGVDIGGTFTDIVLWASNGEVIVKCPQVWTIMLAL